MARLHGLDEPRTLFVRQSPEAIAAGAFHNDVVAIGHRNVLLYHERAFEGGDQPVKHIQRAYDRLGGGGLDAIEIKNDRLSLPDAVSTYLFNSQIIDLPGGRMSLICPVECAEHDNTRNVVEAVLAGDNPHRVGRVRGPASEHAQRRGPGLLAVAGRADRAAAQQDARGG